MSKNTAAVYHKFISVYDNVIPLSLCEEIKSRFDASSNSVVGKTASGVSPVKNNRELYIDPNADEWNKIDSILFERYSEISNSYFSNFPWLKFTYRDVGYFIKKYLKGVGYYNTHVDVSIVKNSHRILGSILYLNTVDEGGETEFTNLDLKIQPVAGRLLLFPPMWMYPHRAVMPVSSDKYTVNTFFVLDA